MEKQPWHSHIWELCDVYKYSVRGQWVDYSKDNDPFGDIWAFGGVYFNTCGGHGTYPSPVKFPGQWIDIQYADRQGFMARKADCSVWSWGRYNQCGNFGVPCSVEYISSPTQIPGRWKKYWLGIGIDTDDNLWTWGEAGHLGNNTNAPSLSMVQIPGKWLDFNRNWCGLGRITGAIKSDCSLWMWGNSCSLHYALCGIATVADSPVKIPGSWKSVCLSVHGDSVIALKNNCTLWAWGRGDRGVLGNGSTTPTTSPIQIPGNWKCAVTTVSDSVYGIRNNDNNRLWGWGCSFVPPPNPPVLRSSPVIINGWCWATICSDAGRLKGKIEGCDSRWYFHVISGTHLGYNVYYPCNNNIVFGCPAPTCQFEDYKFSTNGGATLFINR